MINVILKGVDEFLGSHVESLLTPKIASICKVDNDDVVFTCVHSIIYHGGVDQTSYHMIITFELEDKFSSYEKELANFVLEASKNFAVHCHVSFSYLSKPYYQRIEKDYPLYVTMENEVAIEEGATLIRVGTGIFGTR